MGFSRVRLLALVFAWGATGCGLLEIGDMGCWVVEPVTGNMSDFSAKDTPVVRMRAMMCAKDQGEVQMRSGGARTVSLKAICSNDVATPCFSDEKLVTLFQSALTAEHVDASVTSRQSSSDCEPGSNFYPSVTVYTLDWRATTRIAERLIAVLEEENLAVDVAIEIGPSGVVCS